VVAEADHAGRAVCAPAQRACQRSAFSHQPEDALD
jgi:hypothetical protein